MSKIAAEQEELSRLLSACEVQKIKVEALVAAANARPSLTESSRREPRRKSDRAARGKPKGAISVAWRKVLEEIFSTGSRQSYQQIHDIYRAEHGKAPEIASIRDRVRNFVETGIMDGSPETGFYVTQDAVERFCFTKENEEAEASSDADEVAASSTDGALDLSVYAP